jgi:carbamoyl-phosphate synthase large subunit
MSQLHLDGKLHVTDVTDTSPAYYEADEGLLVPPVDTPGYLPALLEIVRRRHVGLVVPLTDLDLPHLAAGQGQFASAGAVVMIGSERVVAVCRDKARITELFARAGVEPVRTCTLAGFRERPFYPCFVKPACGSAGIGAHLVASSEELDRHVATFGDAMVVQEYIPGPEYTIDVYRTRAGEVKCVVPRQRLVIRSGEVEKGVTVKDPALMEAAERLAESLDGLWGVFCCQCKRDEQGTPRFFEVNARFGGGAPLSIAAGANLPLYLLQEVLGLPVSAKIGDFTDGLLMMRYDDAVFRRVDDKGGLPGIDHPLSR